MVEIVFHIYISHMGKKGKFQKHVGSQKCLKVNEGGSF